MKQLIKYMIDVLSPKRDILPHLSKKELHDLGFDDCDIHRLKPKDRDYTINDRYNWR